MEQNQARHRFKSFRCRLIFALLTVAALTFGGVFPATALAAPQQELPQVYPGGQSIGIFLKSQGVTVVGMAPITDTAGQSHNPAEEAGLLRGDFLTTVNDQQITGEQQLADLVEQAGTQGQDISINFIRNGENKTTRLTPILCPDSQSYRIGLYVRDNTAGVGTLTFYEPQSGVYGALGHQVSDAHADESAGLLGNIIKAPISGIRVAKSGSPGEKMGVFIGEPTGTITKNTIYGLFGAMEQLPDPLYYDQAMTVARADQVETGPAEILTVLDGEKIEAFTINILKTMDNYKSGGKGMIIEITDQNLIDQTGGIIQGMSGSPIIQNGMLVGAVTHVFVNDPLHGYGCFAEWMLDEAGLSR